jgi:hypothetical protein
MPVVWHGTIVMIPLAIAMTMFHLHDNRAGQVTA